jgi:hypothetical protein
VAPLATSQAQDTCDPADPASVCYEPPPPPCDVNDPNSPCYCSTTDPISDCYEPPPPPCQADNPDSPCYEPPSLPELSLPSSGKKHHGGRRGDSHCKSKGKGETCKYKHGPSRIVATRFNDTIYTGAGATTIHGMPGSDKLYSGAGNDIVLGDETGKGGNDFIDGGPGSDRVFGMAGNDTVHGGSGNDVVHGGTGSDKMYGDDGNDVLDDAPRNGPSGSDSFYGGGGNDEIFSRDGTKDYVDCGAGQDVAKVDSQDSVAGNCEQVVRQG